MEWPCLLTRLVEIGGKVHQSRTEAVSSSSSSCVSETDHIRTQKSEINQEDKSEADRDCT